MPVVQAKQEFRDWDAEVIGRIDRPRLKAGGDGLILTHRAAHALAGEWHLWFIARHEDEPCTREGWDSLVEAQESAYMRYGDDVPDSLCLPRSLALRQSRALSSLSTLLRAAALGHVLRVKVLFISP